MCLDKAVLAQEGGGGGITNTAGDRGSPCFMPDWGETVTSWTIPLSKRTGGHQWSGCSVRIRLQLRLPHSFHRLLSIVAPPAHSVSPACSARSLPEWLGFQDSIGLGIHPGQWTLLYQALLLAGTHLALPGSGRLLVLRLKNPVGTGRRSGVNAIHTTYSKGWGWPLHMAPSMGKKHR